MQWDYAISNKYSEVVLNIMSSSLENKVRLFFLHWADMFNLDKNFKLIFLNKN